MAKRPTAPVYEDRAFTLESIDRGIAKLRRRIEQVKALCARSARYDDPEVATVESDIQNSIREVFGDRSFEFNKHGTHTLSNATLGFLARASESSVQQRFLEDLPNTIPFLTGLIARLEEKREDLPHRPPDSGTSDTVSGPSSPDHKAVFVIHGRNVKARDQTGIFLRSCGLRAINFSTLRAEMGGTPTIDAIVEEGMRRAQGVVALFTADEYAALRPEFRSTKDDDVANKRWQARPNVIFEAGMAFGKHRHRVVFVLLGSASRSVEIRNGGKRRTSWVLS